MWQGHVKDVASTCQPMSWPCSCHALAMFMPGSCHGLAMLKPCFGHVIVAMPSNTMLTLTIISWNIQLNIIKLKTCVLFVAKTKVAKLNVNDLPSYLSHVWTVLLVPISADDKPCDAAGEGNRWQTLWCGQGRQHMTNPVMQQGHATDDKPCDAAGEGCGRVHVTYDST